MQPYSVVMNPGFNNLISVLKPRYKMPSRSHLTTKVLASMYDNVKEKMSSADLMALMTDCWTSRATHAIWPSLHTTLSVRLSICCEECTRWQVSSMTSLLLFTVGFQLTGEIIHCRIYLFIICYYCNYESNWMGNLAFTCAGFETFLTPQMSLISCSFWVFCHFFG